MRTLRLSLAGTVILALLGGLGGAAVAQEDAEDEQTPVVVTGLQECTITTDAASAWDPGHRPGSRRWLRQYPRSGSTR